MTQRKRPTEIKSAKFDVTPAVAQDEPEAESDRKYRAPALEKGIDILELMAEAGSPLTLSQISAGLNRSVSELFRMVQALEYKGYVTQAETGEGYVLTNRLFSIGMAQAPVRSLLESALPVMRRLARASVQSCHLAVPSDDQIVVVARIEAPGDLGFSVRIGYRRPMVDATSGAVIFAFQPKQIQEEWLTRIGAHASRSRLENFESRAALVKTNGFMRAESDFVQGVTDISAPVHGAYRAVAALTVPYMKRLPPPCSIEDTVVLVREAAAEISADLRTTD